MCDRGDAGRADESTASCGDCERGSVKRSLGASQTSSGFADGDAFRYCVKLCPVAAQRSVAALLTAPIVNTCLVSCL